VQLNLLFILCATKSGLIVIIIIIIIIIITAAAGPPYNVNKIKSVAASTW